MSAPQSKLVLEVTFNSEHEAYVLRLIRKIRDVNKLEVLSGDHLPIDMTPLPEIIEPNESITADHFMWFCHENFPRGFYHTKLAQYYELYDTWRSHRGLRTKPKADLLVRVTSSAVGSFEFNQTLDAFIAEIKRRMVPPGRTLEEYVRDTQGGD